MKKQYDSEVLKKLQSVECDMCKDIHDVCAKHNIGYSIAFGSLIGAIRHKGFIPWDDDMDIVMTRQDYENFEKIFDEELGDRYYLMSPLRDKRYLGNVIKIEKKGTAFVNKHSKKMKCPQGIFIDIFIYDKIPDDGALFNKQKKMSRLYAMLVFLYCSPWAEVGMRGIKGALAKAICFIMHYILHLIPHGNVFLYKKMLKYSTMSNDSDSERYIIYQDFDASGTIVSMEDIEPYRQVEFDGKVLNIPNNYDKVLKDYYGDYMELPPVEKRVNHAADVLDFGEEI